MQKPSLPDQTPITIQIISGNFDLRIAAMHIQFNITNRLHAESFLNLQPYYAGDERIYF